MKMVSIIFCISPLNMGNALNDPVGDAPGGVKQHDTINMHTFEYWLTCILQQNRILKHFNKFSFFVLRPSFRKTNDLTCVCLCSA